MQKIDRDRLDENTGQIECGEEIGTVFLIDKETAITVKHCLLIEKPETYAKNAVLHFSVKDEEKTVNATVISEDNDSSEDLVVLRCEESIDVQPLYLFSAELDVFDELQMVGYGKSFGFEKRWIQLKNTNLLKKTNKNMILDTIDSAAMDYEGFSGSLIADYNNCIVGIANMQNTEKGKANSLLGISVKNRKKFFENNNIPVYDRAALLNAHCKATKAKAFQNGIDQNVYLKNKQLENDTNSRNIEENTNPFSANGKEISNFVYDLFKQREMRWISCRSSWYYTCCDSQYKGMVYPYTLSDLSRHELKETGLREYALGQKKIDPGKYLYLWKTYPVLEQIVKTGLFQLVDDVLDYRTTDAIKRKGRKPTEFLSVDKKEFRRLRDMNGGVKELKWLQLEKSTGKTIGDEEICWMVKEGFEPNDLKFVLDQMSICQIRHYLVKQSEKSGDDISHVLQVWNDYLSMAKRLGMDIHDSIIYRTRDLQLRHKEAVLKIEEMKRGIRRRELEEKYVGFQKHLIDLKEKYEFSDGEYQVIAPKSIDDILYEGDTLHHCVNKTDTYFDRIVSKESYILFLREKENPKVPFYTLEVEPDGTIRQKRAEFNRQNKDIDKVTSFLTLWQKEIQKRLTKKDRKSTEESRKLRQQNYQEIRDKHVVVHGGAFAGELLADLLEKDLMDLPVESAENGESPTEIAA